MPTDNKQSTLPTSFSGLVSSMGGQLLSAPDNEGFARIIGPDGEETEFNVRAYAADNKLDVTAVSNPDNPLASTALSFTQQMKLALAPSDREKFNTLVTDFGKDNVKRLSDGRISLKVGDEWQEGKVDNAFADFAANNTASTAGAIAGATYMSPAGPVGMALGAGAGALIGKYLNIKTAEGMGIRDERDGIEVSKELASEALLAMAGEAIVPAGSKLLSSGAKLVNAARSAVPKLTSPASKRVAAETISELTQEPVLFSTSLINNPKGVGEGIKRMEKFNEAAFATKNTSAIAGLDPLTKEQLDMAVGAVTDIKADMISGWGKFNESYGQVLNRTHIGADELGTLVTKPLQDLGLVGGDGKWLANIDRLEKVSPIVKASDLNALKTVVNQVQALKQRGAGVVASKEMALGVSIKELTGVINGIDSLIAARPVIGMEVTSDTARALMGIRGSLRTTVSKTLANSEVAGVKEAGLAYDALTSSYSNKSRFLDEIASEMDDGSRAAKFVKNFVSGTGDRVDYTNMTDLLSSTRSPEAVSSFANKLIELEASKRFSGMYGKQGSSWASKIGAGPKNIARVVDKLTSSAKIVNGIASMPKGSLSQNPSAVRDIINSVKESDMLRATMSQSLMQGAQQAIQGGGQK